MTDAPCLTYSAPEAEARQGRIRLGAARCLLGENVRYDGGHKLDRFIAFELGRYVDFVPVCPEVECGLPVPREAVRLVGDPDQPRLVGQKSGIDHSERMRAWGEEKLKALETENLCGYIFKSRSPSSGMQRIKVYREDGNPLNTGVGFWARMFMDRFPLLPVEDDGRLHDPRIRDNFIERVFVFRRWREAMAQGFSRGGLVDFHTRHKLIFMAHSPELYREAGRLVAGAKSTPDDDLACAYLKLLARTLALMATPRKQANVLMHCLGYFKRVLTSDEKQEMLELIEAYRQGRVPLVVPITLINHHVRRHGQAYLSGQHYLNPHPAELGLRNHV